jgi:predicted DNA-binding transcriptional regulator AlpA
MKWGYKMIQEPTEKIFYNAVEICDRYKMSRSTLYRKKESGEFPQSINLFTKKQVWHKDQLAVFDAKLLRDRGIYT